jgi:predicted GNAT family acetyltransferase
MEDEADLKIVDNRERERYEASLDGRFAAYSTYENEPGRVVVTHTVVRPRYEGRGLGSRLVRHVVDDIVGRGLRIKPVCEFTRAYLRRHPQYDAMVDYPAEN